MLPDFLYTILSDADFRRIDAGSVLNSTDSRGTGVDLINPEIVLVAELSWVSISFDDD